MKSIIIIALLIGIQQSGSRRADVAEVKVQGTESNYTFHVTLESPDKGCEQYADWWEVISSDGLLLYRRILTHSHVNEQPFTRSGGPVEIDQNQKVWIRAHMNNTGFGGKAFYGSVSEGFKLKPFPDGLGKGLEKVSPLPYGCRF